MEPKTIFYSLVLGKAPSWQRAMDPAASGKEESANPSPGFTLSRHAASTGYME